MSVNNNLQIGQGRIRVAQFTASGSWTAPAGVFSVNILAVGGGGGGGGATNTTTEQTVGGGGGGGGVYDGLIPVVPGTTYTVTIGTGGAGASAGTVASSNGANTTFGSIMTAPGGQGGVSVNVNTGIMPGTNPGGSWGGPATKQSTTNRSGFASGGGAGSPIIPCITTTAGITPGTYTFFDGFGLRSFPVIVGPPVARVGDAFWPSRSLDTVYPNIKRGESLRNGIIAGTWCAPGWAWKNLGAGGAQVFFFSGDMLEHLDPFIHPTAGKIDISSFTNATTINLTSANATRAGGAGKANSGSGGCGGYVYGTASAAGGSGGSGYLEVTWTE